MKHSIEWNEESLRNMKSYLERLREEMDRAINNFKRLDKDILCVKGK